MRRRTPGTVPAGWSLCASGPAVHTGRSGAVSAVSRMAPVFGVSVRFGGLPTVVLGFLVVGSVFVVHAKWHSPSWHARGMILAAYGVTVLGVADPGAAHPWAAPERRAGPGHRDGREK